MKKISLLTFKSISSGREAYNVIEIEASIASKYKQQLTTLEEFYLFLKNVNKIRRCLPNNFVKKWTSNGV